MEDMIDFFAAHKKLFLTLHFLGLAAGMGGATITDILFFNFLKDFRIAKKEAEVMRLLSNIIMVGLALLFISGAALFLSDIPRFSQSSAFIAKVIIVLVITVNGVMMHKFIAPHMVKLSFLGNPLSASPSFRRMRSLAFAMGATSFTSWYSVFFIAMLKSYLPPEMHTVHILGVYIFILATAVSVSQLMHFHIHRRSAQR